MHRRGGADGPDERPGRHDAPSQPRRGELFCILFCIHRAPTIDSDRSGCSGSDVTRATLRLLVFPFSVALAVSALGACDDEEGFPPNTPANDMTEPPPAPPPASASVDPSASAPAQPPPGTPQPVGRAWVVPFPEEASRAGVAAAEVVLLVTVSPAGAVEDAAVVIDPGHGFGDAARRFALGQQFKPAVDAAGTPIRATTRVRVAFRR